MDHREQTSNAPSTSNHLTRNREEQPGLEASLLALLTQCSVELQNVKQRLAEAQTQFDVAQQRFQELQVAFTQQYAPSPQVASTPTPNVATVASSEEAPDAEIVYPEHGLYAYGFVKKSPRHLDIVGIDQQNKVQAVKGNGLYVIVSEININQFQEQVKNLYASLSQAPGVLPNQDGAILQAHERVIDAIMQHTTIVPLKFGTILRDEQAALKLLSEQGAHFKDLLVRFQGKVECGLKAYLDQRVVLQHMMQHDAELINAREQAEPRSKGAAYLLARKKEEQLKERVSNELLRIAEHIFHVFGQMAIDMKQNSPLPQKTTGRKKEMVLNAVYLVEQEQLPAFYEQAKDITERYAPLALELEFSGPWPPYNFM